MVAVGFIPVVGWAGRIVRGEKSVYQAGNSIRAADQALDPYKSTQGMDVLRKTEYGIYGLASANGFSEYITGKDMFGNALSEAERVNSLQYSIIGPFYKRGLNNGIADDVVGVSGSKKMSDESTVSSSVKGTSEYQVGAYKAIKGVEGLDAHHAGQKAAMKKLVDNYDLNTVPAINVPKVGHTIKGPNGIVSRSKKGIDNLRRLLARDIRELRRVYDDIPNSK